MVAMQVDVLIIGGGLVGASLAVALKSSGLSMALVESHPIPSPDKSWDNRIYAISPGGATFLAQCNIWQQLDMDRVQTVETMRVFGDQGMELDFSAYQLGVPELAFILENRLLQQALWKALQEQDNLSLFHPARCNSLEWQDDAAYLKLEDGSTLKAKLVIGADGGNSWVRQQANIVAPPMLYDQEGVVANFIVEKSHRATAFQWFQQDGILALLPLPQQMVSMVWSVSPEKAKILRHLSQEELCAQVASASHHHLGAMQLVTPPVAFPLRSLYLPQIIKSRLALVGDAAHNIHPLAGQGVNLGFRDARQLAQVLLERGAHQDCGSIHLLRRYERSRKEDILSMLYTTDILKKLFNNSNPVLRSARNFGLAFTNHITPLKRILARHALN